MAFPLRMVGWNLGCERGPIVAGGMGATGVHAMDRHEPSRKLTTAKSCGGAYNLGHKIPGTRLFPRQYIATGRGHRLCASPRIQ